MATYTCRTEAGDAWFTADFDGEPTAGHPLTVGLRPYVIVDVRPGSDFPPLEPSQRILIVRSVYSRKSGDEAN